MNVTVPVGIGPIVLETVAVKVTREPTGAVVLLDISVVVVVAGCTVSLKVLDVAPASFPFATYCAVRAWLPTANVVVEKDATPPGLKFALPIAVVPSKNVIEPAGVPVAAVAVAVSITFCVTKTGFGAAVSITVVGC